MQTNILIKRARVKLTGVLHLRSKKPAKGNVLLSYIPYAFLRPEGSNEVHTSFWECQEMARTFLELGYDVDIIDWKNSSFVPKKEYAYFVDIHANMERIAPFLNKDCVKIFHATGSHWLFQNHAEYARLMNLQKRRGITLIPRRSLPPSFAAECADVITLLGNEATEKTYAYLGKKIYRIPLSATHTYPFPESKNIGEAKKNFVWFGGAGMIHKGLDLVLEAFAEMPEYSLFVCGKINAEKDFEEAYRKELYETKNIRTIGKVDPAGETFKKVASTSIALVYPSCSEGQSGAVVTCLHAGLIPAISYQSGVDVGNFGTIFKENTKEEIKRIVKEIAGAENKVLRERSRNAWEYAVKNHTREKWSASYAAVIAELEKRKLHSS